MTKFFCWQSFRKSKESDAGANLSRVFICAVRQVCFKHKRSLGYNNVVSHADFVFLQMFLWERFRALTSAFVEYSATVPGRARVVSPTGMKSIYKACARRWAGVKKLVDKSFSPIIDKEENFSSKPYVVVPTRIHRIQIFEEVSSEVALVPRSYALRKLNSFLVL